jgi:Rieske Fe-S protein
MSIESPVSRRSVLTAGAVGAGAVALAACGAGTGGGAPSAKSTSSTDANAMLVPLDSITVGEAVSAKLPTGAQVIVARPTSSTAVCFSAICTHLGCTVQPAGKTLNCPCHGSIYDALTGAVIQGPAPKPLPKVDVRVSNGDVVTGAGAG